MVFPTAGVPRVADSQLGAEPCAGSAAGTVRNLLGTGAAAG